jgi:hypothetical protein
MAAAGVIIDAAANLACFSLVLQLYFCSMRVVRSFPLHGGKKRSAKDAAKKIRGPSEAGNYGISCCCRTRCKDEAPERRNKCGAKINGD